MQVTDGGVMPVMNHGTNNLDVGLDESQVALSDAFMDIANETFGIEPEQEEVLEDVVEEEETEEVTDEPESEGEEESEESTEQYYVVTIDGEELEVSEDELLGGYQRQRDYTRKTQEVAEERKQVKADLDMLATERNKYVSALEQIISEEAKALDKYKDIDWAGLRKDNANEFLMLQYEMQEARTALQEKIDTRNSAYKQADTEKQIAEDNFLAREGERVASLIDGWNGENAAQIRTGLREQSKTEGFTQEDEGLLKHAMVIHLLQKAKAYDELQTKATTVGKKKMERIVPKVVKSGTKGSEQAAQAVLANQDAMTKFKQSGNIRDSISIFEQFL